MASPGKCILKIYGGLGNQLFQIANGLAYCEKTGKELLLIPCDTNRCTYYWNSLLAPFADKVITNISSTVPIYHEIGFSYKEIPNFNGDIILDGYFQSSKNFGGVFRDFINWPDYTGPQVNEQTVIVHARRGDYLKNETNIKVHGPLPITYYKLAFDLMKIQLGEEARYILISDDNSFWSNPGFEFLRDFKTNIFNGTDIETLALMKQCNNFIIANSTFSWWGAYLAQAKNVIAPSRWFGPLGHQYWQDIYESSWTIIPVE